MQSHVRSFWDRLYGRECEIKFLYVFFFFQLLLTLLRCYELVACVVHPGGFIILITTGLFG